MDFFTKASNPRNGGGGEKRGASSSHTQSRGAADTKPPRQTRRDQGRRRRSIREELQRTVRKILSQRSLLVLDTTTTPMRRRPKEKSSFSSGARFHFSPRSGIENCFAHSLHGTGVLVPLLRLLLPGEPSNGAATNTLAPSPFSEATIFLGFSHVFHSRENKKKKPRKKERKEENRRKGPLVPRSPTHPLTFNHFPLVSVSFIWPPPLMSPLSGKLATNPH